MSAAVARAVRYAQVERLLALVKSLVQKLNERSLSGHVNASYCAAVGARKVHLVEPRGYGLLCPSFYILFKLPFF